MMDYTTEQFANWTLGTWHGEPDSGRVRLCGFTNDTRNLQREEGFVALQMSRRDGHTYLDDANAAGAPAAIVERIDTQVLMPQLCVKDSLDALQSIATQHRLCFPGQVIGVTGSCGKTSTKDILAALLGEQQTWKTADNQNNALGVPLTLTHIDPKQHQFAVIEAGINHVDEMDSLAAMIQPDIAIITTIAPTHLENLGSLENIAKEKTKLAQYGKAQQGIVIFPSACLRYKAFQAISERALVLCPDGKHPKRHTAKEFIDYKTRINAEGGCRLTIRSATFGEQVYQLPRISQGMVSNVCLAVIAANQYAIAPEQIQHALAEWQPTSLRGEIRQVGEHTFYVDCYNANPASMVDTFEAFAQSIEPAMPRLYVLGCMDELGVDSHALHFKTGLKLKLRKKDRVIILGNYATAFCEGIIEAGNPMANVTLLSDLNEVKHELEHFTGAVLLKGSRRYELEKLVEHGNIEH